MATPRGELRELAALFGRLGLTAFGGPAAHTAMMRAEVVERRGWLTDEEFLDLVGATNLIPGPNSTELAIHIGHRRAGWAGLLVAGVSFILPAALLTVALAWAYGRLGHLPRTGALLAGVKPVIVAVLLQALWSLGRTALRTRGLAALGALAAAAAALGAPEMAVLLAAGGLSVLRGWRPGQGPSSLGVFVLLAPAPVAAPAAAATAPGLFLVFLKVGSVLFGSGYVLVAFLRSELVERLRWLTEGQLLDAVAAGQVTPGPVFTTATFVGYLLGGGPGAALATLGIFAPAFVFVALSVPLLPRMRRSRRAGDFLDGLNAASLALMAVVTWQLARSAIRDAPGLLVALGSLAALLRFRVNATWLVLAGALIGLLRGTIAPP